MVSRAGAGAWWGDLFLHTQLLPCCHESFYCPEALPSWQKPRALAGPPGGGDRALGHPVRSCSGKEGDSVLSQTLLLQGRNSSGGAL